MQESRKALGSRSEGILRKSEMDSQSILRRVQSVSQGDEEQQERAAVRIQARARGNAARKHARSASQGDEERQERAAVRIQARARGNAARKHTHSASQGDEELSRQRVPCMRAPTTPLLIYAMNRRASLRDTCAKDARSLFHSPPRTQGRSGAVGGWYRLGPGALYLLCL